MNSPERAQIPAHRRAPEAVLADLAAFGGGDARYREGCTWSLVYWVDEAHHRLILDAAAMYAMENALNPMAFPSLRRMEAEVVGMTASLLHGPESCVGTLTSGGTESLLLAVKTYRDRARRRWPWIRRPNLVVPETVHVGFDKAAHLFDVALRKAKVGEDGAVDVAAMGRLINRNTIALAASAPQYPHGTVDPIRAIGGLATAAGLPLHVDACFGGFILPWLERIGVAVPLWDFRVPGVTSMSADLHKYGYSLKGASAILYRDMSYLRHQFFVETAWAGGIYASPTLPGARGGAPIAAAWASLQELGEPGFLDLARQAWEAAERLRAGIAGIEGLRVLGRPHSTIVTWGATPDGVDIHAVADQMQARGWNVDRQQRPASVHLTVNASNAPVVGRYLEDLREAVRRAREHPELAGQGEAAMYGMMAKIPVKAVVREAVLEMMEQMYAPGAALPDLTGPGEGPVARARALVDRVGRAVGAI